MTKVYLLRHGKVTGDAALYGHTDVLVDKVMDEQIIDKLIAQKIDWDRIVCSPLKRCANIAQRLAGKLNVPIDACEHVKEMNFGIYDGIPFEDLYLQPSKWQQLELFWQQPAEHAIPEAESMAAFHHRVITGWCELMDELVVSDPVGSVLIVCHGGVIRMILAHLLGVNYRQSHWYTELTIENASLTAIECRNKSCTVNQIALPLLLESSEQARITEQNLALAHLLATPSTTTNHGVNHGG